MTKKHYDVKLGLLLLLGGWAAYDYQQSRPVVWCLGPTNCLPPKKPHYEFKWRHVCVPHDVKALRRGYEVYRQVCATCHSLRPMSWYQLVHEVLPPETLREIASSFDVEDGPNDQGEMFTRPAYLLDQLPEPYPNENGKWVTCRHASYQAYQRPALPMVELIHLH
eukprot:GHVN01065756.1.p1 GENE.GHVN01065756.1~~GHVN01065756.1.p1  ORF type:complete len:165 (-),score=11.60 GHVN01065756.1:574-1068(-)